MGRQSTGKGFEDRHDEGSAPVPAPSAAHSGPPAPLIVLQYRRNWWSSLLPPLFLLLLAAGVVKYRVETPDWGGWRSARPVDPIARSETPAGDAIPGAEAH